MAMSQPSIDLRQYYRAVLKRFWLVVLFSALVMAVVFWRMGSKPPTYSATTLLMVTAPIVTAPPAVSSEQGDRSLTTNVSTVTNDIVQLIGTRPVTERVAKILSLKGPEVVKRSVRGSRVTSTDLVSIRATSADRELAPKLANTSAEVLITHFREVNRRDAGEVRLFIEGQLAQAKARLQASDKQVETYKIRHGILVLENEMAQASSEAAQTRIDRENALKELRETDARLMASSSRLNNEKQMRLVSGTIKDNPVFQQMGTRLTDLELQRATLSQTFTPLHPKLKVLEGEIATVRQQMRSVAKKVADNEVSEANPVYDQFVTDIASKQVDRAALLARIDALSAIDRLRRSRIASLPRVETRLNQLVRESTVLAENYSTLFAKYQDALIRENEAGYTAGIHVMEPAVAPTKSVGYSPLVQYGIAGLVGLLLGIVAALLLETTDDRIRTSGDAERAFGAPVLAEVPDVAPPMRVAPAGAALLLIVVMLLVGVAFGRVLGNTGPQVQPTMLTSLSSRLVRGVEVIPVWLAQAVR